MPLVAIILPTDGNDPYQKLNEILSIIILWGRSYESETDLRRMSLTYFILKNHRLCPKYSFKDRTEKTYS